MNINQSDITSLNETGLFYKFALPNILSFILMSSAGIVDGIFMVYLLEIMLGSYLLRQLIFHILYSALYGVLP